MKLSFIWIMICLGLELVGNSQPENILLIWLRIILFKQILVLDLKIKLVEAIDHVLI
jgi:hypothetical protein